MEMRTLRELSEPPYALLSHGRLRRAVNDGVLHAHRRHERARWEVAEAVALAWRGGATYREQKRSCPMCAHLAKLKQLRR